MSDNTLILAAARLSSAAPHEWMKFLEELKAYADRRRDEMMRAPPAQIYAAQGRAQEASSVHDLLQKCRTTAAKIQGVR